MKKSHLTLVKYRQNTLDSKLVFMERDDVKRVIFYSVLIIARKYQTRDSPSEKRSITIASNI